MAWPTQDIPETDLDAGTDQPKLARPDLLLAAQNLNTIKAARDQAEGIAGLNADRRLMSTGYTRYKGYGQLSRSLGGAKYNAPNTGAYMDFNADTDTFGGITNRVADARRLTVADVAQQINWVRIGINLYFYGIASANVAAFAQVYKNAQILDPQVIGYCYSPSGDSTLRAIMAESPPILAQPSDYFYCFVNHNYTTDLPMAGRFWMEILE
jgi:hypothetical protein